MEPLKFFRIREDAKIPVKHHKQDAGIDLFYCPHPDGGDNVASNGVFVIPPGASCLLATGLRVEVPQHVHMLLPQTTEFQKPQTKTSQERKLKSLERRRLNTYLLLLGFRKNELRRNHRML